MERAVEEGVSLALGGGDEVQRLAFPTRDRHDTGQADAQAACASSSPLFSRAAEGEDGGAHKRRLSTELGWYYHHRPACRADDLAAS